MSQHPGNLEAPRVNNPASGPAHIIRRAPTGAVPVATPAKPGSVVPITACAVAILGGWATSVMATELITGWWRSDRLFCIAVGFLALVFAATTLAGVILLLRRRPLGRYLIAIGAAVAVLTFAGLFVAGARVPWIVHAVPAVHLLSAVLALHPASGRWVAERC